MIRSSIILASRKNVNDTDTSDPFHTDAQVHGFIDAFEIEIAIHLKFPRKMQTITFVIGDGGATGKSLNTDFFGITGVWYEPTGGTPLHLRPTTEKELTDETSDWRTLGNAAPARYFILDAMTAAAAAFPSRSIGLDRTVDTAGTLRIYGSQFPAASTTDANSPLSPPAFQQASIYYCCWQMSIPRNKIDADYFEKLWMRELRTKKTLVPETNDKIGTVWDSYDA